MSTRTVRIVANAMIVVGYTAMVVCSVILAVR